MIKFTVNEVNRIKIKQIPGSFVQRQDHKILNTISDLNESKTTVRSPLDGKRAVAGVGGVVPL